MTWREVFGPRLRAVFVHPFTRHSAILQVAGIVGKVVGILTGILYANLLGPEEFGRYALAIALAGFLNVFQEFGLSHAMVNLLARAEARHDRAEAQELLAYFLKATVAIGATAGLAGVLVAPWLGGRWYHDPHVGWYAALGVLTFALTFFVPLVTTLQQVRRELVPLTLLETGSKIVGAVLTVTWVLAGGGVLAIVGGQFIVMAGSSFVAAGIYTHFVKSGGDPPLSTLWRTKISWEKISYYFRFGLLIAVSKNILKINQTVPLLVLGAVLPTTSGLGFYKVAFTYVGLPLVLADPVARLLNDQFPKTEVAGTAKLFRRFYQITAVTLLAQAAVLIPAVLAAPWLLRWLFPAYVPALPFIWALSPYPLLVAGGVGLAAMFRTLNRMRINVLIQLITLAGVALCSWLLIPRYAIRGLVGVTLLFTLLPNALGVAYFLWLRRRLAGTEQFKSDQHSVSTG